MSSTAGEKSCLLCECISSSTIDEETSALEFFWGGPNPAAGQFFLIKPERFSMFLGRPISVANFEVLSSGGGTVRFIIVKRGRGSREIMEMRPGESAYLTGPLGNSWSAIREASGLQEKNGIAALVSGGVGVAPVAAYAQELAKQNFTDFDFYAGFRSVSYGLEGVKARKLVVALERCHKTLEGQTPANGVRHQGRILDFFQPENYSAVFACGPHPMLKVLAESCKKASVPCFVSMEKNMACGTGACLGCTIKTLSGNKRCCADGPIFNSLEINFE